MLPKILGLARSAGKLHARRVRYGKGACKCAPGYSRGPYHYLHWRDEEGRPRKGHVRAGDVASARTATNERRESGEGRRRGRPRRPGPGPPLLESVLRAADLLLGSRGPGDCLRRATGGRGEGAARAGGHRLKSSPREASNARHHPPLRAVTSSKFSIKAVLFAVGCMPMLGRVAALLHKWSRRRYVC